MSKHLNCCVVDGESPLATRLTSYMACMMVIAAGFVTLINTGCASSNRATPVSVSVADEQSADAEQSQGEELEGEVSIKSKGGEKKQGKQESAPYIDEAVLAEGHDLKVTAKSYQNDGDYGPTVKVLIENNSEYDYYFSSTCAVNGYMTDDSLWASVPAGKKSNTDLTLDQDTLSKIGIKSVETITLQIEADDSEYTDSSYAFDIVTLPIKGIDAVGETYDESGKMLYDKDGVQILFKQFEKTIFDDGAQGFAPGVLIEIVNQSDKSIIVDTTDTSVNGYMMSPLMMAKLFPNTRKLCSVEWMADELQDSDIDQIEEIELAFEIYDANTFDTIASTDTYTITRQI